MKIFLNYAKEDKEMVDSLYLDLIKSGFQPWMDKPPYPFQKFGINPGEKWKDVLEKRIRECDLFIACLSSNSVSKKGMVQQEYRWALDQRNTIPNDEAYLLPLLLTETEVPNIRVGSENFKDIQWYEFYSRGYNDLAEFIKSKDKGGKSQTVQRPKETIFISGSWTSDGDGGWRPNKYSEFVFNELRNTFSERANIILFNVGVGEMMSDLLYSQLQLSTVGITILTKDHETVLGDFIPRSNVVFELGYHISRLGIERNLLLVERGVRIPSNISNMIYLEFTEDNLSLRMPKIYDLLGYLI